MNDLEELRGYWRLTAEVLDRTAQRTRYGRGYRLEVRQTEECMKVRSTKHTQIRNELGIVSMAW